MSIKDSFNSALIKSRPYTLDFGFMTDALNFLIYEKVHLRTSSYFFVRGHLLSIFIIGEVDTLLYVRIFSLHLYTKQILSTKYVSIMLNYVFAFYKKKST